MAWTAITFVHTTLISAAFNLAILPNCHILCIANISVLRYAHGTIDAYNQEYINTMVLGIIGIFVHVVKVYK